ncbi:hypothetical protein ACZ90_62980 [Streptomyces albus subsp. albus]|nr:hypothetical protein ACZ90_62980 [Streptomyces albus subsp. albus]
MLTAARCFLAVGLSVAIYYLVPLDHGLNAGTAIAMAISLLLFIGVIAWQIRSIIHSAYPRLRAIEMLATMGPIFLVIFSAAYVLLFRNQEGAFSESLSRTDALYFTVTVFATVGFGDITPRTETARILTMAQMLADLVLVGLVARIVLGAVQASEAGRTPDTGGGPGAESG